jgi:CubicO group peptidase (beta-lactamase class C family)
LTKKPPIAQKTAAIAIVTLLIITTLVSTSTQIPTVNATPNPTTPQTTNITINSEELQTFVDQEIQTQLNTSGTPGAAIAIVKDNNILLAKGYGVADKETNNPVIANQTLFRVASVTKLFTWTAIMQLAEQGKLDLDADVNTYLKTFQIPKTFPQSITLKNLMAHNAGFESDELLGKVASASDLLPLGDYLARYMPARVRPPAEVSVYSNYGASLAGYIVEQVSGTQFEEYVQTNILEPLKMEHTTFQQPPPQNLAQDLSKSYTLINGVPEVNAYSYYMGRPAGVMCSTATDMAHFIICHLQNGAYDGSRILQDDTAKRMHSQLFTMDPRIPGFAYGFMEYDINGQRIIGHFGDLDGFRSALMLVPEQNLGWFVVYNGESDAASPGSFFIDFLNHYFPTEPYTSPNPPLDFSARAGQFTGFYRDAKLSLTTFQKLTSLTIEFDVTSTQHGTLLVRGAEYVEAESFLFRPFGESNPWNDSLVFLKDSQGQVQYFANTGGTYERVPWFETSAFTWTLMAVCFASFVSMIVFLVVKVFSERGKPRLKTEGLNWARGSRFVSGAFSVLFILAILGIRFAGGNLTVWYLVMVTGAIGSLLAVLSLLFALLSWKRRYWSLLERLHYVAVTMLALAFVWFLGNWNLLSFRAG